MSRVGENLGRLKQGGLLGERYAEFNKRTAAKDRNPLDCFTPRKCHTKIEGRNNHDFNRQKLALVAKRTDIVALTSPQKGQISIFFSASLVVFISIIAFVINVGLFVKAKINLQNATDAAAFAGAAVQSRQLTNVAYLNWEMRNIYKEWMYKYYVVGSLNTPGVVDPSKTVDCNGKKCTDFRLAPDVNAISGSMTRDDYNFPAVCIHIAKGKTNICKNFAVPGLPEFGGYNIPGTEEASRSFVDTLIGSKVNDCVERSKLNMLVTTTWAYNVMANDMDDSLAGQGPAILTDRQGAWPRAMEVAMRIRNLEKVINRKPVTEGVCLEGGGCTPISTFASEKMLGNERIVKAFYSGYRNLGNESDNEMKKSFTLTELAPNPYPIQNQYSTSNLLIPDGSYYEKNYVDLKLMMVNLTTFYAALVPRADTATSGACDISKVGIPVPGYPLGFYKNPDVLTYYAVKGEAEFVGMFNPFSSEKIKLVAYAAAKPAGGRIGPMLFTQKPGANAVVSRTDANKPRSVPYVSSLDVVGTFNKFLPGDKVAAGQYGPGVPLPINIDDSNPYWLTSEDGPIGGLPDTGNVQFGIPNMPYDFQSATDFSSDSYLVAGSRLYTIEPGANFGQPASNDKSVKAIGLYSPEQFSKFRGTIAGEVSPEQLNAQIARVRAATRYEAANYMIPSPNQLNFSLGVDSFGSIGGAGVNIPEVPGVQKFDMQIYAPLFQEGTEQTDLLYKTSSVVFSTMIQFMRVQAPAMKNYIQSLNSAALQTYKTAFMASAAATGAQARYKAAAEKISDIGIPDDPAAGTKEFALNAKPKTCDSLAGQFWHFYMGHPDLDPITTSPTGCPVTLGELLRTYFAQTAQDPTYSPVFYKMQYNLSNENFGGDMERLFSAYMPGPYNGIGVNGKLTAPPGFPQSSESMRRNFYSTKLVSLDSLQQSGVYNENSSVFVIYSEGELTSSPNLDRSQGSFVNYLDSAGLTEIKH